MQNRHTDRMLYFSESAHTSERYFMPYIRQYIDINASSEILEVGCGEGGNLYPFATLGCHVTGIDISINRIRQANQFYADMEGFHYDFINSDMFGHDFDGKKFDLIICHDVIEHISRKQCLLNFFADNLKPEGVVFLAFPPWQMPFGGHQQICHNRLISVSPFIHLTGEKIYRSLLSIAGENRECIHELLCIRQTRLTIEGFNRLLESSALKMIDSVSWFINPTYEQKFTLKPRKTWRWIDRLPFLRNFFTTSFFCILKKKKSGYL